MTTDASVAAIKYALETDEGLLLLRLWNEGEFETIRREWPDVPEEVFIGADPLHPKTKVVNDVENLDYVCADCGHHQDSMQRKCDKCGSVRMVTKKFAIENFGENYMDCFIKPVIGGTTVHAEIEYTATDGGLIHSDICPPNHSSAHMQSKEYREFVHQCLDEWLDKSNGTGGFYIMQEGYKF